MLLGVLLWGKLHWVDRLPQLHRHFVPGQLHVPEFVVHLDDVADRPRALPAPQSRPALASGESGRAPSARVPPSAYPSGGRVSRPPITAVYSPLHQETQR